MKSVLLLQPIIIFKTRNYLHKRRDKEIEREGERVIERVKMNERAGEGGRNIPCQHKMFLLLIYLYIVYILSKHTSINYEGKFRKFSLKYFEI